MNYKEKAEAYVREQLPELMELNAGCKIINKVTDGVRILTNSPGDEIFVREHYTIIGHPIQPHHWLKALRLNQHANWMLASVGDNFELIDMTDYGSPKFKNKYMIIGHENFYKRFCEEVGISI